MRENFNVLKYSTVKAVKELNLFKSTLSNLKQWINDYFGKENRKGGEGGNRGGGRGRRRKEATAKAINYDRRYLKLLLKPIKLIKTLNYQIDLFFGYW